MKRPPRPGMLLVATRELRWMRRDRVALFLAIGVPLIAFALLAFTFSNPVIRDLRVNVVDDDRSSISMTFVQAIASAPGVNVAQRSTDLTNAMHPIRSGEAIASVYIPPNFQRDFQSEKRPQIVVFFNRQYLTPGNNASSALSGAIDGRPRPWPGRDRPRLFSPGPSPSSSTRSPIPPSTLRSFCFARSCPPFCMWWSRYRPATLSARNLQAKPKGMAQGRGWQPACGAFREARALVRHFRGDGVDRKRIVHGLFAVPFRGDVALMGVAGCLLVLAYLAFGALSNCSCSIFRSD